MPPQRAARRTVLRPLAPATYLIRNTGKTLPMIGVIMLAVLLVMGIISMINSIPYSIRTIYAYSREMLGITPRGDPSQTPKLVDILREESPVPLERIMICRASGTQVQSIVGKWPFVVLGLGQEDMKYYLQRQRSRGITGRLPRPGEPEAIVSQPVAQNLQLELGSILQGPEISESYSPQPVEVVGIAHTDRWLMLNTIEYQRLNHFPPIDFAMAFAENLRDQERLDRWAEERFKGLRAQIFAYFQIEKSTNEMFQTLYKILNVVIGTLVLVITFMMGMLINIYQSQRLQEFGLLQAIGYTKRQLLRRVIGESVAVVLVGWVLGVLLAVGLLRVVKHVLMDPKAFSLNILDPAALLYTVPLPITILLVALVTVVSRFRRFDPVGVVERRLV